MRRLLLACTVLLAGSTYVCTNPSIQAQTQNRAPGTFPIEYRDVGGARCFYWPGSAASLSCLPLKALE